MKVTLTDGFASEVFERQGVEYDNVKKLDFDAMNTVKRVKGADNNGESDYVYVVKLMDKQGRELDIFDPYNTLPDFPGKEHHLGDNEDLIGVYGVMGKNDSFSAFGFIVRVREDN